MGRNRSSLLVALAIVLLFTATMGSVGLAPTGQTFRQHTHETWEAGITASTTQTQGQQPLVAVINQVAVVANMNDVVTLPTSEAAAQVTVINDGANTLQIFPAGTNSLGRGNGISYFLEMNEVVTLIGYDNDNWRIVSSTEILHAEIHDENNTDAFVINAQNQDHLYHSNGIAGGDLIGWTFEAGGSGTSVAASAVADGGGGQIEVTTSGVHGLIVGSMISLTGFADSAYNDIFLVDTVGSTTTFEVTAVFTATGTGTVDQGWCLIADMGAAGQYSIAWTASASSAGNNQIFNFGMHMGETHITGSRSTRKFSTGGDIGPVSGVAIATVAGGDALVFHLANETSAGNITIKHITLVLVRL